MFFIVHFVLFAFVAIKQNPPTCFQWTSVKLQLMVSVKKKFHSERNALHCDSYDIYIIEMVGPSAQQNKDAIAALLTGLYLLNLTSTGYDSDEDLGTWALACA